VNRERAVAGFCDGDKGLERKVQALLRLESVLDDLVGFGEPCFRIAPLEVVIERDVGIGLALQMLEVRERAGRLEHFMDDDLGFQRLDFVVDCRKLLVLRSNQLHRLVGDMGIARQHGGDRLADVAYLVDGEDRLIVESRAVIRLRDQLLYILPGDDAKNSR
jgi:hypothetical protein